MNKVLLVILASIGLSACAPVAYVNERGEYVFDGAGAAARAANAASSGVVGLLVGVATGSPLKGFAAGAALGAIPDPHVCAEGKTIQESATTSGGQSGQWAGTAQRERRCGTHKGSSNVTATRIGQCLSFPGTDRKTDVMGNPC